MLQRCMKVAPVMAMVLLVAGCKNYKSSSEKDLIKMDTTAEEHGHHHSYMVDNAVLRDMSLVDFHFVPHTDELSGTGVARLNRMAPLLNTYGGFVRYDTLQGDDDLIERRINHVREYLALAGVNMDRVDVGVAMPGGRGMPATEAIEKYRRGPVAPDDRGGSATFVPVMAPGR